MNAPDSNQHLQMHDSVAEAIKAATKGLGNVNVLIAGKTGVGKSTLINAIFRGDFARTGFGEPVTQKIEEITKPGHPLTIIDTKGLEVADYARTREALETLIEQRATSEDQNRHIHVAWLCIQEGSHRVEKAEVDLCNMLTAHRIPVVVVLTKTRKDSLFLEEARKLLRDAKSVLPVRAMPERIEEADLTLPPIGLDPLIEVTSRLIPEAQQRAYANALSTRNKKALEVKKRQAENEVNISAGLASAAAAIPIPFSDAFTLIPIQVGMIAKIGVTFGMELSTATLTTLVTSALGSSAATLVGRAVVSTLLKLIPGGGSVAGGAIAAATAGAITKSLGNAYVAVLYDFCQSNPGKEIDLVTISNALQRAVRS